MGEAREVMNRITAALDAQDLEAAAECYASDAVAETPDQGQIRVRDAITQYFRQLADAFPDVRYELQHGHESGNVAIDEGYVVGTHTAPLPLPSGDSVPATGKQIRVRSCDIISVEDGLVTSHHFYFDQLVFLGQLGLLPEMPS